jgi:hypothetical protein
MKFLITAQKNSCCITKGRKYFYYKDCEYPDLAKKMLDLVEYYGNDGSFIFRIESQKEMNDLGINGKCDNFPCYQIKSANLEEFVGIFDYEKIAIACCNMFGDWFLRFDIADEFSETDKMEHLIEIRKIDDFFDCLWNE